MTACRIVAVHDPQTGGKIPACTVHCHYAPCPHYGEPAVTVPIHCDEHPSREKAVQFALNRTGRARPVVAHRGVFGGGREHQISDEGDCWCGPEVIQPATGETK